MRFHEYLSFLPRILDQGAELDEWRSSSSIKVEDALAAEARKVDMVLDLLVRLVPRSQPNSV